MRRPVTRPLIAVMLFALACTPDRIDTPTGPSSAPLTARSGASCANRNNNDPQKVAECVTLAGVRAHIDAISALTAANGDDRNATGAGFSAAADYVADQLRAAGYVVTEQAVPMTGFTELEPTELDRVSPNPTVYVSRTHFRVMDFSPSGEVTAAVTPVDYNSLNSGCDAADFAGFPAGNIALVYRGFCTFVQKAQLAAAAGASALIVANNVPTSFVPGTLREQGASTIPVIGITQSLGQEFVSVPTTVHLKTTTFVGTVYSRNIIADLPAGGATTVVLAGAQLNSFIGSPGINTNASGVAALLETAIQMSKTKLEKNVRFAFWGGDPEDPGAELYVNGLSPTERSAIEIYLDFMQLGSPNGISAVVDGDGSSGPAGPTGSGAAEAFLRSLFAARAAPVTEKLITLATDWGYFRTAGVPSSGITAGSTALKTSAEAFTFGGVAGESFDPCAFEPCDNINNLSLALLELHSDIVALAVSSYAMGVEDGRKANGPKPK